MKFLTILFTIFTIIVMVTSQGCQLPEFGAVAAGTKIQKIGTCEVIECLSNNHWKRLQCAMLSVRQEPNYSFKTDLSKQFPDCCEKYTADN